MRSNSHSVRQVANVRQARHHCSQRVLRQARHHCGQAQPDNVQIFIIIGR
jgi:hypothetical protein